MPRCYDDADAATKFRKQKETQDGFFVTEEEEEELGILGVGFWSYFLCHGKARVCRCGIYVLI